MSGIPRWVGYDLKELIESSTGREAGVDEVPENVRKPFYNIRTSPGPTMDGGLGTPNSIDRQVFMIDIVGSTRRQVQDATKRLLGAVEGMQQNISDVMGPPEVRRNGVGREDDRTYRGMVVITVPVTGR